MRRAPILTTVTALSLALALAGCGNDEPEPTPLPTVASQDEATPAQEEPSTDTAPPVGGTEKQREIALEAAKIMTTWTPAEDKTRTEAEKRARHLMTDERAEKVVSPERAAGAAEWGQAAEANATSVPDVELNKAMDGEYVEVRARWTWETPDGETVPDMPQTVRYYRFAFDPEQPDKIAGYDYQDRLGRPGQSTPGPESARVP